MKRRTKIIGLLMVLLIIASVCSPLFTHAEEKAPETLLTCNIEEPVIENISLGDFKITAYCACKKCCGKEDGITKTGTVATENRTIAVDPKIIPLGSQVEINGVTYIDEDIGGAIKENRIDIFFSEHTDALKYGVQYHEVFLIEEV